jgi:hypothetical protein
MFLAAAIPGRSAIGFGVQGGLALPQGDLALTAGKAVNLTAGLHGDYLFGQGTGRIRTLAEYWAFSGNSQDSNGASFTQHLDTRVHAQVLGVEFGHRVFGPKSPLTVHAGIYLVGWSVASTDTLGLPGAGSTTASGTSRWSRAGAGVGLSCAVSSHLDAQVRWVSTHYGYENLPVGILLAGMVWDF